MSYIRLNSEMRFVKGKSDCYIFPSAETNTIEDYGKITDKVIVELLFRYWKTDDSEFKEYLLKKLAERLYVELRKNPLTNEEWYDLSWNRRGDLDDERNKSTKNI